MTQAVPELHELARKIPLSCDPRIAFAANRNIGLESLQLLVANGIRPVAILVPHGKRIEQRLVDSLQATVPQATLIQGRSFRSPEGVRQLRSLNLDYMLSVHFPYLIPRDVLDTLRMGALNLHPAYLPYNRGWHTPSWAILDQTPYGATLHWIDEGLDTGDLVMQKRVEVLPSDTADSLYARVLAAEVDVLRDAIPRLKSHTLPRIPQSGPGTQHVKTDLESMRRLHLHDRMTVGELLRRIRALTTNCEDEAAWFELDGERYLVQLTIRRDANYQAPALRIHRAA